MVTSQGESGKAKQWRERMARYAASGQQIKVFCQAEGVSEAVFYRWRQRLADAAPGDPGFIALPTAATTAAAPPKGGQWEVRLDLGNGLVLHLARH